MEVNNGIEDYQLLYYGQLPYFAPLMILILLRDESIQFPFLFTRLADRKKKEKVELTTIGLEWKS